MRIDRTDTFFARPQFSIDADEKQALLLRALNGLTEHHRSNCAEYGRMLDRMYPGAAPAGSLADVPYLPVGVFKTLRLKSVPDSEVFKVLRSSGTTSAQTSFIYLDRDTATLQTKALAQIMASLLGPNRLRMLIIDSADVIKDRLSFSARGAGILGMSTFGRDHFYALKPDMELDEEGLRLWLGKQPDAEIFLFGFTFMAWSYFFQRLAPGSIDLSRGILVHGGGWKKMQDSAVSKDSFKAEILARTRLARVHDFYGMVEQAGSIFIECEHGFLHAPNFAHVIVRDPETWGIQRPGQVGLLQVLSVLPGSYPGHSLLTEDLGTMLGEDDCRCGRRGAYFLVHGRVPKAVARGCSDTHVAVEAEVVA